MENKTLGATGADKLIVYRHLLIDKSGKIINLNTPLKSMRNIAKGLRRLKPRLPGRKHD